MDWRGFAHYGAYCNQRFGYSFWEPGKPLDEIDVFQYYLERNPQFTKWERICVICICIYIINKMPDDPFGINPHARMYPRYVPTDSD